VKLFRLYEQAIFFNQANVKYFRYIGYTLFLGQLINPIYEALMSFTMTWLSDEQTLIMIRFGEQNVTVILVSAIIILISWIMGEAARLQEEQKYIV
jgi:hypothetical protein